jgi:hypothetical protein
VKIWPLAEKSSVPIGKTVSTFKTSLITAVVNGKDQKAIVDNGLCLRHGLFRLEHVVARQGEGPLLNTMTDTVCKGWVYYISPDIQRAMTIVRSVGATYVQAITTLYEDVFFSCSESFAVVRIESHRRKRLDVISRFLGERGSVNAYHNQRQFLTI